jgi:MFS family permease
MAEALQSLPPGEPGRSLRYSVIEGSCYTLMASVSASAIVTAFAAKLGATDAQFSFLTAAGSIATMGSMIGAVVLGRVGSRKRVVMGAIWNRTLWIALAAIPLLHLPAALGLKILMAVILLTSLIDNVVGNAWMSWMTDLVPAERRNRYFGLRNAICGTVGLVATWSVAQAFDYLKEPQRFGDLYVYAPFFAFAAFAGWMTSVFMRRKWEPPTDGERAVRLSELVRLPLSHPGYRRLLGFHFFWTLATAVSTPFWRPHMLNNLHMDMSTIAIYGILAGVTNLVTQPLWGHVIDRTGSRPVMIVCLVGISALPLFWLFARPDYLWMIWWDAVLTGILWPGFNLAGFNLQLQTAPREHRAVYLASLPVLVGITGFAANLFGGAMATAIGPWQGSLLGFPLVNYHAIFVLSAVGRLLCLPLASRLPAEKAVRVKVMLNLAADRLTDVLADGWHTGVALIRKIRPRWTTLGKPQQAPREEPPAANGHDQGAPLSQKDAKIAKSG